MNRLQNETSPYLRQHADNPVDWYPWGEEALKKSAAEDKPILLSIGYSACHWCHVMAHESFEDDATAEMMNRYFVNIKVDREERPDLDDIYMRATQIFQQGGGGWPMTVFLTPQGKPFHAGTYYPKVPRYGMPSFREVMQAVHDAYRNRRDEVAQVTTQITQMLETSVLERSPIEGEIDAGLLERSANRLVANADMTYGGLHGGRPKFPNPMNLDYLLRYAVENQDKRILNIVCFTLTKMAQGGIYDQLGFGFARYSVDEKWLVPHFEKMLYDNAQLARVYLHAYQLTRDEFFATIFQQILIYVEREMLDENGGFYSSQDADSEGEEGKFFLWTEDEFDAILQPHIDGKLIVALKNYWDVTKGGNFEGKNILNVRHLASAVAPPHHVEEDELLAAIEQARELLFVEREKRIKPGRDEKMLAAWNGMMLAAFAEGARIFPDRGYQEIAKRNADFILSSLSMDDGRLYRTHKEGESKLNGYLEDYACVVDGLLEVYQTTFETKYFEHAQRLADHVLAHFTGQDGGGFYDTSDDHEVLIVRPRSLQDNATPSGNNLMVYNLLRLHAYTGDERYESATQPIFAQTLSAVQQYPSAFGMLLSGMHLLVHRPIEVAIIADPKAEDTKAILDVVQGNFRPRVVVALASEDQGETTTPELLAYRSQKNAQPTVYVCENFTCALPVTTVVDTERLLNEA